LIPLSAVTIGTGEGSPQSSPRLVEGFTQSDETKMEDLSRRMFIEGAH